MFCQEYPPSSFICWVNLFGNNVLRIMFYFPSTSRRNIAGWILENIVIDAPLSTISISKLYIYTIKLEAFTWWTIDIHCLPIHPKISFTLENYPRIRTEKPFLRRKGQKLSTTRIFRAQCMYRKSAATNFSPNIHVHCQRWRTFSNTLLFSQRYSFQ